MNPHRIILRASPYVIVSPINRMVLEAMLVAGSSGEAARLMGRSTGFVSRQVRNTMKRWKVKSEDEIMRIAVQEELIGVPNE